MTMSSPDLFVVCKNCQAEVSPYITECPYCGTRLRKRAPKIEREPEGELPKPPKVPRSLRKAKPARPDSLGRLRAGEIPGIRGDETGKPWATIVLVFLSLGVWLSLAFVVRADLALTALGGDPWRYVTAPFLNDGTAAQLAAVVGVGLYGSLIERRYGPIAVIFLFLLCGPGALAAATAVDPDALVFGTHPAALGLLTAWLVPVLLARRRGADDQADLLGTMVIASVLLLVPVVSQGNLQAGLLGGALGFLGGLALAALPIGRR